MTFHRINEDPFYDDDGNLVDEDADGVNVLSVSSYQMILAWIFLL